MTDMAMATITMDGDRQVVRLPEGFRLPGDEVRVSRSGEGLVLEPMRRQTSDEEFAEIFNELEKYKHVPFMENGREQPTMPDDDDIRRSICDLSRHQRGDRLDEQDIAAGYGSATRCGET